MATPKFTDDNIDTLYDAKYLRLYDLKYDDNKHYFDVSRRPKKNLVAAKPDSEFQSMLPDAVTIAVTVKTPDKPERLLLNYEFRYPTGHFILSPIAGLIDEKDKTGENPLIEAAKREIFEECGLTVKDSDVIKVINPCAFSSPGMTDESNAFLYARITTDDESAITQAGAEGTELFGGYELVDRQEAKKLFDTGRDKNGNFYSIATWVVLAYFLMEKE